MVCVAFNDHIFHVFCYVGFPVTIFICIGVFVILLALHANSRIVKSTIETPYAYSSIPEQTSLNASRPDTTSPPHTTSTAYKTCIETNRSRRASKSKKLARPRQPKSSLNRVSRRQPLTMIHLAPKVRTIPQSETR